MNNFTTQCENKLELLDVRLKKMNIALTLLEAKVIQNFPVFLNIFNL